MSSPNAFTNFENFAAILDNEDMLEGRFENDGSGNPIYIGFSPYPNANPAMPVWYIRKIIYDGASVIRTQLPDEGIKFAYVWDDRIDYFT